MEPFARVYPEDRESDLAKAAQAKADEELARRRRYSPIANLGTFTGYRIGLDIGNGNVGWCVLFEDGHLLRFLRADDIEAHNAALPKEARRTQIPDLSTFVPLGTHKFDARVEKTQESLSKVRAKARASTRLRDARQRRKLHVGAALRKAGLLPNEGQPIEGHRRISADKLRVRLLDPAFEADPHDLGRALLNLYKRRGYMPPMGRAKPDKDAKQAKGTGKAEDAGTDEGSAFAKGIEAAYRKALADFGCRTVGEFLDRCARDAKADGIKNFRKRHKTLQWQKDHKKEKPKEGAPARSYEVLNFLTPTHALIREEGRILREAQGARLPLDDKAWAEIEETAEFRRPLQAKVPGRCRFLPTEFRCVRALPSFQHFRILEQISFLRDSGNRALDDQAFAEARAALSQSERLTIAELSRKLGAGRLTLKNEKNEDEAARTLVGAKTDLALAAALGEAWMRQSIEQRDKWVMRFLRRHEPRLGAEGTAEVAPWSIDDERALKAEAEAAFGPGALDKVDDDAAKTFTREDGFSNISVKAASIRAECYEKRLAHDLHMKALRAAGMPEPSLGLYERLPYYGEVMPGDVVPATGFAPAERTCAEEKAHGRAANPDVHVVMNRVRAVVNAIIDMMGGILPTTCVVEMARSALSEDQAKEHLQKARERERLHDLIRADIDKVFEGLGRRRPRGPALDRLIDRWKAAMRQGWRDYNGEEIQRSNLIDSAMYQLDHVSPAAFGAFQKNNLFVSRFNRDKGRKLPWEAFGEEDKENKFRPALIAFAEFGLEQRVAVLEGQIKKLKKLSKPPAKKLKQAEDALQDAKRDLKDLEKHGEPRGDVLNALKRTLTSGVAGLVGEGDEQLQEGQRSARRPFEAGDQASLFRRFGPAARKPEREFAARDVANIGYSTKLTLQYLTFLGATAEAVKPWAVHALRCMFGIDKERSDLRNHAVDAFLIAHFDGRVLRPAFDELKDRPLEEMYSTRELGIALDRIGNGAGFLDATRENIARLEAELRYIATAHRANNMWNPGDAAGGSFGALGGQNIYAFRPDWEERKRLTGIARKHGMAVADGQILAAKELLDLAFTKSEDKTSRKIGKALNKEIELRYLTRGDKSAKPTTIKLPIALPLPKQPGAFIDGEGKFAIIAAGGNQERRIVSTAEFSKMNAAERAALFADKRPIYRNGDTVILDGKSYVVTGLMQDGRIIAYPVDEATRDPDKKELTTVPSSSKDQPPRKFASDVLGRRLYRLRKSAGGVEPVPYPLRGE
jgi:hypothetical protein